MMSSQACGATMCFGSPLRAPESSLQGSSCLAHLATNWQVHSNHTKFSRDHQRMHTDLLTCTHYSIQCLIEAVHPSRPIGGYPT